MTGVQTNAVLQLVVDALLGAAAIQALVENRVHGAFAQFSDLGTIPKPAIAVEIEPGGAMGINGSPAFYTLAIFALSASGPDEAFSIYEAARDVLHAEALCHSTNGHRGSASEIQRPHADWIPSVSCWFAVGRYRLVVVR